MRSARIRFPCGEETGAAKLRGAPGAISIQAATLTFEIISRNPLPKPIQGDLALPAAVPSIGLSASLARLLDEC